MGQLVRIMLLTSVLVVTGALVAVAQPPAPSKPKPAPAASSHKMITPDQIKWGPAPPSLPPGAQLAVLDGDPAKPGSFTIRGKFPDGYVVPPHWHPTDEHVVVISGTLMMGTGDKAEPSAMHALAAGSFSRVPKTDAPLRPGQRRDHHSGLWHGALRRELCESERRSEEEVGY